MKKARLPLILLALGIIFIQKPVMAQDTNEKALKKVIIERIYEDENGNEIVEKVVKEGNEIGMQARNEHWMLGDLAEDRSSFILSGENLDPNKLEIFVGDVELVQGLDYEFNESNGRVEIINDAFINTEEAIYISYEDEGVNTFTFPHEFDHKQLLNGLIRIDRTDEDIVIEIEKSGDNPMRVFNWKFDQDEVSTTDGRPLLGIYPKNTDEGVYITSMVDYCGAIQVGIKGGDYVKALDGTPVESVSQLHDIIQSHEPGYVMQVTYLRDGQEYTVESTLCERQHGFTSMDIEPMLENFKKEFKFDINVEGDDIEVASWEQDENPKPWIGIYMEEGDGGVHLSKIIDASPAQEVGLQSGDIVTAIDGQPTDNITALINIVEVKQPGDVINMTYVRNGEVVVQDLTLATKKNDVHMKVFKDVDVDVNVEMPELEPVELEWKRKNEIIIEGRKVEAEPLQEVSNELQLEAFTAFPNPSAGDLTIRFNGEAGEPITLTLTDASGRQIYRTKVKRFDGNFNDQMDISDAAAGPVLITVTQGGKTYTSKVIYTGRP